MRLTERKLAAIRERVAQVRHEKEIEPLLPYDPVTLKNRPISDAARERLEMLAGPPKGVQP